MSEKVTKELYELIIKNSSLFEIPSSYSENDYFPDVVKNKLDNYYDFLVGIKINDILKGVNFGAGVRINFLNRIGPNINAINESINLYYKGKVDKAQQRLNTSLDKIVKFKDNVVLSFLELNVPFYRIRIDKGLITKRRDNFHISFDLRHLSKTQRYSIPGVPSLYLGDTAFICFQETLAQELVNAYISRFIVNKLIPIIEIQTLESFIKQFEEESNQDLKLTHLLRFLLLFPLYVASTVKVYHQNAFFKTEYIIPQLLMQYVRDEDGIKGIKFPSTKIDAMNRFKNQFTYNYVFPIRNINKDGFCSYLSEIFELTKPKSIQSILNLNTLGKQPEDYLKTDFYRIESNLLNEKTDNVLI